VKRRKCRGGRKWRKVRKRTKWQKRNLKKLSKTICKDLKHRVVQN
jgi:hypothetical protein